MLTDKEFIYPFHLESREVIRRINNVLGQSDEVGVLLDPKLDLGNFVHRCAFLAGLHPFMLLIGLQREQSLIANNGVAATDRQWSRAVGVVGQHTAGTANDTWDGLPNQILLASRSLAWVGGLRPKAWHEYGDGLYPTASRWTESDEAACAKVMDLLNDDGSFARKHVCKSRVEYAEMAFTPSTNMKGPDLKIRADNYFIFEKYIMPLWGK